MIAQWFPNDAGGQLFKVEDWFEFEPNGFDIAANNDADLARRTILLDGQPAFVPAPYRFMFRKRSVNVGSSANDYSLIYGLIDAVSPADNPNSATIDPDRFSTVADWEAWMQHFAIQRTVGNWDSYGWERGKNDYLYRGATGGFRHMPWDIDYCLGLGKPANEPLFASNDPRVTAMFNTPALVRAYWRAFAELVDGPFSNANLDPHIDARANALVANSVNIDLAAVAAIKQYIADRRAFLQGQLATVAAPFAVDVPLNFATTNNLIVITGTAPVAVKEIALNGAVYPIIWTSVSNFTLRVVLDAGLNDITLQGVDRFGNPLASASNTFSVNYTGPVPEPVGSLLFSEIMYAPATNGGQFIEIRNVSGQNFDLSGWRLDGANLTFPIGSIVTNGQIIVLAQNRTVFTATYGNGPVFAVFNGTLSATGQRLLLVKTDTGSDILVDAVRYEAGAPWPARTAGLSLQLVDVTQDNSRAANWATSLAPPATPGAPNSVAATLTPFDPLWLNEVQFESLAGLLDNAGDAEPWLELYNAGTTSLSLDGYYLADNYTSNLLQWAFPAGTTIASGEHLLIWGDGEPFETDGTNVHSDFRLDYQGRLALVRLAGGQPQITDYLTWRLPFPNVSYGDFPDGQPVFRSTLHDPTPRAANTRRPVAIMINEWMARNSAGLTDPADNDRDDWFELYNAESFPVDLGGYYLTDTDGFSTKFRIPATGRYTIPAGGFLLVWADNETNQNNAARADLHVTFQLGGSSGIIGLFAPDGLTPVDYLSYLSQTNDISEGRFPDGAGARYFMPLVTTNSTPRGTNTIPGYNLRPFFPPLADQVVTPGTTNTFLIRATDLNQPLQSLTYSLVSGPPGSLISQGGFYRWIVPSNQPPGDYSVTVGVTDNGVPPRGDTASFICTVRLAGAAPPPAVTPPPVILTVAGPGGQVTFTIETIPGRTYRVLRTDNLSPPTWVLFDRDFVAAGTTASLSDTFTVPRRFYQVLRLD
jgi:hypothetical protein